MAPRTMAADHGAADRRRSSARAGGESRSRGASAARLSLLGLGLVVGCSFPTTVVRADNADKLSTTEILLRLYDDTRGMQWKKNNHWLTDPNVCNWHGIHCWEDGDDTIDKSRIGQVKKIDLTDNKLVGTVPQEVWDIPYLESFHVKENPDVDVTFHKIKHATYLKHLILSKSGIKTLEHLDDAEGLTMLHITDCYLGGEIPSELYRLRNLEGLFANYNDFTGPLSTKVERWTEMKELYLYENELTGQLPSEIGDMTNLQVLALSNNAFSGSLPTELNELTNLEILALQREAGKEKGEGISGPLPDLSDLHSLTTLMLQNQKLNGAIPANFLDSAPKAEIVTVDLSNNELSGGVPTNLDEFSRMKLYLQNNQLTTPLDVRFCDNDDWMGGDVKSATSNGCDAILCPVGTYNAQAGRETSSDSTCETCAQSVYLGATECKSPTDGLTERQVLTLFYNQMGGAYWKNNKRWLSDDDLCNWHGIDCNSDDEISSIDLTNNNLAGTVPKELFEYLPSLKTLTLTDNAIDFKFKHIGAASKLKYLYLYSCGLTSLKHVEELKTTNIRELALSSNKLAGEVPKELFDLVQLEKLSLSHNAFTGTIPTDVGKLTSLESLHCYGNELTGQIPTEIGLLTELEDLVLSENNLGGTLPTELNLLTKLEELSIHQTTKAGTGIGGTLPPLENLEKLAVLHLHSNALQGDLPPDLLKNSDITDETIEINLSDNKFTGTVPGDWDRFEKLNVFLTGNNIVAIDDALCNNKKWMFGLVDDHDCNAILCPPGTYNEYGRETDESSCDPCATPGDSTLLGATLCGGASTELTERDALEKLYFGTNGPDWDNEDGWMTDANVCNWYGISCHTNGAVKKIALADNALSGTPPKELWTLLPELKELDLQKNDITFDFDGIENAVNLHVLYLSNTNTKSIEGVGKATNLKTLHLTDNGLSGPLPDELFDLINLEQLFLNYNQFSGKLSSKIGLLTNLEELFLLHNQLEGQIPAAIGSLTKLKLLALTENSFSGTLPEELNDLTSIEILAIQREGGNADDTNDVGVEAGVNQGTSEKDGNGIGGPLLAFDKLKHLKELYLGSNSLTGSIPVNFLNGVEDKDKTIIVDLIGNQLSGKVPSSLVQFDELNIFLAGNKFDEIADGLCNKKDWMDGAVDDHDCDAILCPKGKFNEHGRQPDDDNPCQSCDSDEDAPFLGSFECLSSTEQQNLDERAILQAFYEALDGRNWRDNSNWLDHDESICTWAGITCVSSDNESVEAIHLSQNSLYGSIPTDVDMSIFDLPNLRELNLANNPITFSFNGINRASQLHYLNLDGTDLTSLSGIEAASQLTLLHVMSNKFTSFPNEILSLVSLEVLYLSHNDINGALPSGMRNLNDLVFFACSDCGLSGNFPDWIGDLTNLEYLRLDKNSLGGGLPVSLESLTKLKHLDLSDQTSRGGTGLTGSLIDFDGMGSLAELYLFKNNLDGAIPPTLLQAVGSSTEITVDLRSNQLTGAIPTELASKSKLNLYLSDNQISTISAVDLCTSSSQWNGGDVGTFSSSGCDGLLCGIGTYNVLGRQASPETPCKPCDEEGFATTYGSVECGENLQKDILEKIYYDLNGPEWTNTKGWLEEESVCDWHGVRCYDDDDRKDFVERIKLEGNNLNGKVPREIFSMPKLRELRLKENIITFEFDGIEEATDLEMLSLSQTGLQSLNGIEKAPPSLKELHLTSNQINGEIPEVLFELTELEGLYLNYNGLTGNLSTKIGQMTKLKNLFLFHNKIHGSIPTQIGNLKALEILALGENLLSGDLPTELNSLPNIEILSLQREAGETAPGIGGPLLPKEEFEIGSGLTGPLLAFDNLPKLNELYLGTNSLTGFIPSNFLKGVEDKSATIKVDLTLNELLGEIPSHLGDFTDMNLFISGNQINNIANELCLKEEWMSGEVENSGCDAIVCPPNTFNEYGRQVNDDTPCEPCAFTYVAEFYGSIECAPGQTGEFSEREILRMFYEATNGDAWTNKNNWLEDNESICKWHGVHCLSEDGEGAESVSEVHLPSNKLSGTVPPIIYQLPNLELLNLNDNQVSVEFEGIGSSPHLKELYLDSTKVTSIDGIGQATKLKILSLQNNDFGGREIPNEMYSLVNMKHLKLSNSNFGGKISPRIGDLTKLEEFYVRDNILTGQIPSEIGELSSLEVLVLSENSLIGELPSELNQLTKLKALFLDSFTRNTVGVSGPLPAFDNLPDLRELYLGSNSLTGTIPKNLLGGVDDTSDVITIGLRSNQLTGTVPSELSRFTHLDIDLAGNEIVAIDDSLCDMDKWMGGAVEKYDCDAILCPAGTFHQYGRQENENSECIPCSGVTSPFLGSLVCESEEKKQEKEILTKFYNECGGNNWKNNDGWLDDDIDICHWYGLSCHEGITIDSVLLGSNNLVGTPPKEIFEMTHLKWLWLYSNPITFSFEGIGNAKKLTSLLLDSTGLKSLAGVGDATNLVDLDVRFNQLQGNLPVEVSNLINLETLSCADNNLSGPFPTLSSLQHLKSIRASNNNFSGDLPDFSTHSKLKSVDLSGNNFGGQVPSSFLQNVDNSETMFIDLSSNKITGIVPEELERFNKVTLYMKDNRIGGIAPTLCGKELWNDGDVGDYDCDGILCPEGTWAPNTGRATKGGPQCAPCDSADYFGTSRCTALEGNGGRALAFGIIGFISVAAATTLAVLEAL